MSHQSVVYDVRWLNDSHNIVYAKYPTHWTWTDFYKIRAAVDQLIDTEDTGTGRVDVIADLSDALMPKGSPFIHARTVVQEKHPRVVLLIVVANNALVRSIASIAFKISPQTQSAFRLAASIDEAVRIIEMER